MSLAHQPELLIAGLLSFTGLGLAYFLEYAITSMVLFGLSTAAYLMLKPPTHKMEGYGTLNKATRVRTHPLVDAARSHQMRRAVTFIGPAHRCPRVRRKARWSDRKSVV